MRSESQPHSCRLTKASLTGSYREQLMPVAGAFAEERSLRQTTIILPISREQRFCCRDLQPARRGNSQYLSFGKLRGVDEIRSGRARHRPQ